MLERFSWKALRTTLYYVGAGLAWIVLSDAILLALTRGNPSLGWLQSLKGGVFVGATGILLFFFLRREFRAIERRDAQLRDAAELLRLQSTALESAANAIVITDRQGRITWVNPAFTQLTGYAPEEALGQNPRVLKSGQHDPAFYQDLWETITAGKVWRHEIVNRRKDGMLYTEEMTITPVKDGGGAITHFIGIKQDVSERKQAEAALCESEARFRSQVEATSDWVWEIDERGLYTYVSPKVHEVLGYEPEELLGKSPFDFMPVEEARRVADLIAPVTGATKPFRLVENVNIRKGGERVILETSGTPIFDAHGVFRGYRGIDRDITERRRADRTLETRTRQLEALRLVSTEITRELELPALLDLICQRALELVGANAGGIMLWDETARLLVPRVWRGVGDWVGDLRFRLGEGMVGTVAEKRQGLIVNDYRQWPGSNPVFLDRTPAEAVLAEPLLYHERLVGVLVLQHEQPGRTFGEEHRELVNLFVAQAAIAIENARLFAELDRSYRDLQRAQDELVRSEKLRALGQMVAGIAHELNNILSAILGQVELLRLRGDAPAAADCIQAVTAAANDGAAVVRRLQEFARQRTAAPLTPLELAPLIQEALDLTRPHWREAVQRHGHVIQAEVALDDLPPILGNAPEIREALANVFLNAADAMPVGGSLLIRGAVVGGHLQPEPSAATGRSAGSARPGPDAGSASAGAPATPGGEWVELRVEDTGIGMPEDVRRRIFEPFFTTKGGRGSGLGLSIVYSIMERHGGHIAVTSIPGQGTTVTLRFQPARPAPAPAAARTSPVQAARRLLLVEDDGQVREALADLLRTKGHTVLEADGGAAALSLLTEDGIDLVITDLGMPGMSGWDVAKAVKNRSPNLPVLLLTGWGDRAGQEAGESAVDRVMSKPVRLQDLQEAILEMTEASQQ